MVLDEPELQRMMLSTSPSLRKKGTPSRALLQSPSPPKTPLGEIVVPHHPRRPRPHRESLAVALKPPRWWSGHGAAARCIAPPPSPTGAAMSHPDLDHWPRLDHRYPFVLIKSELFNQSSMAQVCYWIDKISAVHFNFYGWENVPLHDLISRVHLRFNDPC
jgi:hypothetical protein